MSASYLLLQDFVNKRPASILYSFDLENFNCNTLFVFFPYGKIWAFFCLPVMQLFHLLGHYIYSCLYSREYNSSQYSRYQAFMKWWNPSDLASASFLMILNILADIAHSHDDCRELATVIPRCLSRVNMLQLSMLTCFLNC